MKLKWYCVRGLALASVATWAGACTPGRMVARAPIPTAADSAGIERLHRLDVAATLADKADSLETLWDPDAIRLQPGGRAEIGRTMIYTDDKRQESKTGGGKTVCYRSEIQDLQIAGDWAFEWGYFSYREMSDTAAIRGKVMRIQNRHPNCSCKYARDMGFVERNESAAPLANPCR
jgi:hypothetical protein